MFVRLTSEQLITIGVSIGGAIILAYFTALFTSYFEQNTVKQQISHLEEQKDLMEQDLQDQKNKTAIMKQELVTFTKSLEKESLLSVKVLPRGAGSPISGMVTYETGPYKEFKREYSTFSSYISLIENQTYTFDIIITNIGADTAVLNYYETEYHTQFDTGSSTAFSGKEINTILKSSDEPLIIKHDLKAEKSMAPNGTLYFTVIYDNGFAKSDSIQYRYYKHQ